MNFAGTFDANPIVDGAHPAATTHVDSVSAVHAPSDAIIVSDAHLLFHGDFKRSGVDLILSEDDRELVLSDYFKGEKRAALSSPDGAHLTGDIVDALTGHVQVAQANGSASVGKVIGHVTKLVGTATAIRNGVSIILNNGDNVEKGDVVQSGSDSTLGITFIDGTVFGLASNARMVLNEMVYDPNGSNNSSLLSLVRGTISFVAGETAKHGDMKIDTPVATMGIRGTAVLVEIDFEVQVAPVQGVPALPTAKFQVLVEPDGTTGNYILFDKVTLAPMATVSQAGQVTSISQGNVSVGTAPLSAEAQKIINDVFALKFTDNTNPNVKTANGPITDTVVPQTSFPIKLADNTTVIVTYAALKNDKPLGSTSGDTAASFDRIGLAPAVVASGNGLIERFGITNSSALNTATGTISFADPNAVDLPTVKAVFNSFTVHNAQNVDITATLTAGALAAIAAVEVPLVVVPTPGNNNNGSATWTYQAPDHAFDFLAAGETLTLTYLAQVDNNFSANNLSSLRPFEITITGTNDPLTILGETNPATQAVITQSNSVGSLTGPVILSAGINTNSHGLPTETFDNQQTGSTSNNGAGHGDFHSATLDATFSGSGNAGVVNGFFGGITAPPFIGPLPGTIDTTNYLSIGAGGTETIQFGSDKNTFGLYWGSVDTSNTIAFYHGNTLVASYSGVDIAPLFADGNQGSFSSNGYVEFLGMAAFDKVVLSNGNAYAFEIDSISAGSVSDLHPQLAAPISGTISLNDADIGDTPTGLIIGNGVIEYNGSATLPGNVNVAALAAASAVTFENVKTNGGVVSLHWTYDPTNPDLDFLRPGDTLTVKFNAQISDGHGSVGNQQLTINIVGADTSANMSSFSVVSGTTQNDTFNNVGGNVTIFGGGGHDTFVFNAGFGGATIGDFDVNNDAININHALFANVSAIVASAQPTNSGHDTIITDAAHDTITLIGVTVAQIQAHQGAFHLV